MKARAEAIAVIVALALAALATAASRSPGSFVQRLERGPFDLAQRFVLPPTAPDPAITVVVVDDESLVRLGERWPLDRRTWGRFLETAARYEPAAVMLDVWFETPSPRGEAELALDLADTLRDGPLGGVEAAESLADKLDRKAALLDPDRQMAAALAKAGRVALGAACLPTVGDTADRGVPPGLRPVEGLDAVPRGALPCGRIATSIPTLTTAARAQAGLTVSVDDDGVSRRYPYVFALDGKSYPSMALSAALMLRPDDEKALVERAVSADYGRPGMRAIPRGAFRTVRFSDVLEAPDDSPPLRDALTGRTVLVGVSALGTEDFARTSLEHDMPGIFVHATALDGLLKGRWVVSEAPLARGAAVGGLGLLLLVALIGWRREQAGPLVALAVGAGAAWLVGAAIAFRAGVWLPVVPVTGGLALWLVVRMVFVFRRGAAARHQARAIRHAFQHYLAPAVVEALVENPDKLQLGGERREITAFFSDIAGFTGISEKLEPGELVTLLNEALGSMTEIILSEGGTVDKYIGDAIVAMFGAPLDQPDHAARACRAAVRCQAVLSELRPQWKARGLPEVRVRIGLNSGPALVGNMGSSQRFDYTMLGDTVNLAARLEGANSQYGTWVMAGESTRARADDALSFRELDAIRPKGKAVGVHVFEVVGEAAEVPPETAARHVRYAEALAAYRARLFDEAASLFGALADDGDAPARTFVDRVALYAADPPPPDWDGIFTMTTK